MEKVIYFCKKCRSTFGGEPGRKMSCTDCGYSLVCTDLPVTVWREMTDEEKEEKKKEFMNISDSAGYKASTDSYGESSIGKTIKTISFIFLVLSIIGSLVIFVSLGFVIGLIALLSSLLGCCLCIGVGEICNLLNSINNKLK